MNIESTVWLPLVSGLIGALIGGAASVITVFVQSRHEQIRHRTDVICDMAMKESEQVYERMLKAGLKGRMPPPVVWMHYYAKVLKLIEAGDLDTDAYKKICEDNDMFMRVIDEIEAARPDSWTSMKRAESAASE